MPESQLETPTQPIQRKIEANTGGAQNEELHAMNAFYVLTQETHVRNEQGEIEVLPQGTTIVRKRM